MGRHFFRFAITPVLREARIDQGKRLRALRHDRGLSLQQIQNRTGVHKSTLDYAERGGTFLRQPELITLCAFYGVTVQWVVNGGKLRRALRTPLETVAEQVEESRHLPH